ncbi:MAG: flagellar basal body protein FliL [Alphaproteobacteria bacterium]|nr:MAG: flagellar basal body protein FliL [Alphaproteobacteria bacterium]
MSEELDEVDEDFSEENLAKGLEQKKFGGKKLVLFVVAPLVLLLLAGGIAWSFLRGEDEAAADPEAELAAVNEPTEVLFYDLPEMLVNLNSGGRKASYLKVRVALEVDRKSALQELETKLPRVIDDFQIYLRELRIEDLNGSAGMFRLKEELLRRVNTSLYPTQVKDVLFKEMLVQ